MKELEQEFGERAVTLSTGERGLRVQKDMKITVPTDAEGAVIDMRASDDTLDRYQEVIQASGWKLDNYRRNPVIQNSHQYGDVMFTLGKALRTEVQGNELVQRWQFAVNENPIAKVTYDLYKGGYLNTSSVGFIPLKWENGTKETPYRRKFIEQELLEVSAVGIPANPNALALAVKSGAVEKSDLKELAELLQQVCKENAETQADAGTPGQGFDGVPVLRLLVALAEVRSRL
jgi:HK97 family phage prohead protease